MSPPQRLGYAFKSLRSADPTLLDCADILVRPGDTVWDIGANIGLFAVAAAVRAGANGKVFAFEPDLSLAGLLRRSAGIQSEAAAPIEVLPVAIAKAVSIRQFAIAARARASNALAEYGATQMGGVTQHQLVAAFNLDSMLAYLSQPDVLKIDVEGAAAAATSGRRRNVEHVGDPGRKASGLTR